jgi:hypothetical protein
LIKFVLMSDTLHVVQASGATPQQLELIIGTFVVFA